MRDLLEDDGDLGRPRAQPLAGAQVEGRPLPAPVRHLHLQRDEAFGGGIGVLRIGGIRGGILRRTVLPAHDVLRRHRLKRADDLQLFVPDRVGVELIGRLHRDQAEKLHHMVLHHVPHGARLVIIGTTPAHAHGFGHRDLDVIDMARVPQRLEQYIGEAHRHQVLNRLFPEVVVDAVDLAFREMLGQRRVQRHRAFKVTAKGFFDHDPRCRRRDLVAMQPFGQIAEQGRRDGEIEGLHHILADQLAQLLPAGCALRIDADIVQMFKKPRDRLGIAGPGGDEFRDGLGDEGPEPGIVQFCPRGPDDAGPFGDLPRDITAIKPRQDLAPGKIARAAKDDEVECLDRDDAGNHVHLAPAANVSANRNAHSVFAFSSPAPRAVLGGLVCRCAEEQIRGFWARDG